MSGFDAAWLAMREPHDHAARGRRLEAALAGRLGPRARIVDLGAGTGANLRHLAPALGSAQEWLLVDDDPALLACAIDRVCAWARGRGLEVRRTESGVHARGSRLEVRAETRTLDLATGIDGLVRGDVDLVTASALLDLVSEDWLAALAGACAAARASALFALTYDGRVHWEPPAAGDGAVHAALDTHQLRDKGFGPALGPRAASVAETQFDAVGAAVESVASDWRIGCDDHALQAELVRGWAGAAAEVGELPAGEIEAWREHRLEHLRAGRSTLVVGHRDLLALPA